MSDGEGKVVRRNSVISSGSADKDVSKKPSGKTDFESAMDKIPYPKAVFFIVVCEFCERFCYYGMRAVLTLYFKNELKWDEDFATVIYHTWVMLCYFTPILGAMLADSMLGKFRTIFYLSVIYCLGSIVLSLAATGPLKIPTVPFSMIGLALIALGTGGIKPCVSAFGGDQFKIPGQESQLESFFAIFYFSINSGSLITQIVTPIFREDVSCFDNDTCFPLAFSVPAALMIVALGIFLLGRPLYKIVRPDRNVVLNIFQAVGRSFTRRRSENKAGRKREHWLDYADDKFDQRFLDEAKVVFKVLFLYIPLPIFWTLFDQQGSRWTFQATRMNGRISGGFGIKADQMQVANPILVLIFIPIFDRIIYPLLAKCHLLKSPLQRLGVGLFFAGVSFVVSGLIELTVVPTYAVELAKGESNLHIVNTLPCQITIAGQNIENRTIDIDSITLYEEIKTDRYEFKAEGSRGCEPFNFNGPFSVVLKDKVASTFILKVENNIVKLVQNLEDEDLEKSENGDPKFRFILSGLDNFKDISLSLESDKRVSSFLPYTYDKDGNSMFVNATEIRELEPEKVTLNLRHSGAPNGIVFPGQFDLQLGGSYVATIVLNDTSIGSGSLADDYSIGFHEITTPNTVHMLWQLPQFVIMTAGEIMFSITIMDFSYTESPPSMKSVLQGAWLLTVAFGNLIVVIIAEVKMFEEQWKEFFLFAGIMFAANIVYAVMAYYYKPTDKFWVKEQIEQSEREKKGKDNAALDRDD